MLENQQIWMKTFLEQHPQVMTRAYRFEEEGSLFPVATFYSSKAVSRIRRSKRNTSPKP